MTEPLSLSSQDRRDLDRAQAALDSFWTRLDEWRSRDACRDAGAALDVGALHFQARDLTRTVRRIQLRHAKRLEARSRRGSPLQG